MSGNTKLFGSRIITLISFMSRALPEKNAFADFRRQFIMPMRREKDKANTFKGAKKRIIKGLPMQAKVRGHISSNKGRSDFNEKSYR